MQAGKLDRQIVILSYTETTDNFGGISETYVPLATVWAEVLPLRGIEKFAAQQANSETITKFRIRYRADVSARDRISWKGREYDITGVPSEIGRNEILEILGKARDEL